MWHARTLSEERRDFRLITCWDFEKCFQPVLWFEKRLHPEPNNPNIYVATAERPVVGWRGFLVEVTFKLSDDPFGEFYLKFSSEVNIIPDTRPFKPFVPFVPLVPPSNSSSTLN